MHDAPLDMPTPRGTVLIFPGRTEYIEKYGRVAAEFSEAGFTVAAIDWRGQGLADRVTADKRLGHVSDFAEFQQDVRAYFAYAEARNLPKPWFLLGHSMGGCIGLRALLEGAPVAAAGFSAPMWGVLMTWWQKPIAVLTALLARPLKISERIVPGTSPITYVEKNPFDDNTLTRNRCAFDYMRQQARKHPELTLGGPTIGWLKAAMAETRALAKLPAPDVKTLTFLGSNERIVQKSAIRNRMARWANGELIECGGAEHELLMETAAIRERVITDFENFFR